MPVLTTRHLTIDYTDDGQGDPVVLVHSSVSSNRQWRALTEVLKDRYRVLALNMYGYGETTPWPGTSAQTLYAQAQLVLGLCDGLRLGSRVHVVGHSFGGLVALKSAMLLGPRVGNLILFEPNPAHLLKQNGRTAAYLDARSMFDHVKSYGPLGDWTNAASFFADYWLGEGAWSAMPEKRRAAFIQFIPPVLHECDAAMNEQTTLEECQALTARTLLISDAAARFPIREIINLLATACPHWTFRTITGGGHMAPLTRPDLVNPIIREFLDGAHQTEEATHDADLVETATAVG